MREYEEGILLFEATKLLVWDKASQDSSGLAVFFDKNQARYRWEERARMSLYRVGNDDKDQLETIRAYAESHSPEEVLSKFNTTEQAMIAVEERTMEKTRARMIGRLPWNVGGMSDPIPVNRGSIYNFYKIEELIPPGQKSLGEARGYAVADYQDHLEAKWVEELRKTYKVKVDRKVFNNLVK
jgi:peptidyl-prolyl cis-trans isomerase SurA